MFPGTYMIFAGIPDDTKRADLVAFLGIAAAPGGLDKAISNGLIAPEIARVRCRRRSATRRPRDASPPSATAETAISSRPLTAGRRRSGKRR